MIKAVIFDVDGTLVDSNDFHVRAWQEAFQHFGKDISYAEIRQQIGKGGDLLMPVWRPWAVNRLQQSLEGVCRSELAREGSERWQASVVREQARSYTRAGDWLRPNHRAGFRK